MAGIETVSAVARVGLGVSVYLGGRALGGLYVAGRDTVGSVARVASSRMLGEHLALNHVDHRKATLTGEIVRRQEDYGVVDLCTLQYVLHSALNGNDMVASGREYTYPHIAEIEQFMLEAGIREPTVVKAVGWVRDVVPEVLTPESYRYDP